MQNIVGKKTPDELIDLALDTDDTIISTNCACCSKIFYVLKSKTYTEHDFRKQALDYKFSLENSSLTTCPKCPHCGYIGYLSVNL